MSSYACSSKAFLLAVCCVMQPAPCLAVAIENIKEASDEVRKDLASKTPTPAFEQKAARLEQALKDGQKIISSLESQVDTLRTERIQLVQVQTALTSGLIAALVTAIVAIAGAIINARNSRPDRDLKRLSVLEKAQELRDKGVRLPLDIRQTYL